MTREAKRERLNQVRRKCGNIVRRGDSDLDKVIKEELMNSSYFLRRLFLLNATMVLVVVWVDA